MRLEGQLERESARTKRWGAEIRDIPPHIMMMDAVMMVQRRPILSETKGTNGTASSAPREYMAL
jgi:hypothetical protein